MRCDFDLDGEENSVYEVNMVAEPADDSNPFENAFYAKSTLLESELNARSNLNLETARYWKIVNHNRKNRVGEPVAYKFMPGDNCIPFASRMLVEKRSRICREPYMGNPFVKKKIMPRETILIKARAATGSLNGPAAIARSQTGISCFGIPWGTPIYRAPRIIR